MEEIIQNYPYKCGLKNKRLLNPRLTISGVWDSFFLRTSLSIYKQNTLFISKKIKLERQIDTETDSLCSTDHPDRVYKRVQL